MNPAQALTGLDLDVEAFIAHYWQKKPCLLRNAIPGFETLISPEELAGLACEEDVHCRLVMQGDRDDDWQLRYGPFTEQDFLALPDSRYSLLVSECEKWLPELHELLALFRFIPDWRVDDLMISYAPERGSVGPHVDQYDVFLLQALGTRRWQYRDQPSQGDEALLPDLELAILQDFEPQQEAVLHPGDILYLPPGFAHHGVALERCMTYSIGYRAPTVADTLESVLLEASHGGADETRYRDADLETDRHHAELTQADLRRFRTLLAELLDESPDLLRDAIGKLLTDSEVAAPDDSNDTSVTPTAIAACEWIRHPATRLMYHRSNTGVIVYCNGRKYSLPCPEGLLEALQKLCENHHWHGDLLRDALTIPPLAELVGELVKDSAILKIVDD